MNLQLLTKHVGDLIAKISGNILEEKQKHMVEGRLSRRMIQLGINDPNEYLAFLKEHEKEETEFLLGLLTTHHTFFFREYQHFELLEKMLPSLVEKAKKRGDKKIKIWSSACSRGHEAYSLSIFLKYHLALIDPSVDYQIIGTDIDPQCVSFAGNGVYHYREVEQVPQIYLTGNFIRGKGNIEQYAKISEHHRHHCQYLVHNLLDDKSLKLDQTLGAISTGLKFDVIFCRNVLIYFSDKDVAKAVDHLKKHLDMDGYLFTGMSESLIGRVEQIEVKGSSCYQFKDLLSKKPTTVLTLKDAAQKSTAAYTNTIGSPTSLSHNHLAPVAKSDQPKIYKVLCVDDSPSILKLLAKIFIKEQGYEIVGTAADGEQAHQFLQTHQVDLMTLDIHMPVLDGVSYLKKYFKEKTHPPVLVISSVSRNDSELAQKALIYGAFDFIEKPSLQDFEIKSDEIRMKGKVATQRFKDQKNKTPSSIIDVDFAKKYKIDVPKNKTIYVLGSAKDRHNVIQMLVDLKKENQEIPMVKFFCDGPEGAVSSLVESFQDRLKDAKVKVAFNEDEVNINKFLPQGSLVNEVHLFSQKYLKKQMELFSLKVANSANTTSINKSDKGNIWIVFGGISKEIMNIVSGLNRSHQVFLEESTTLETLYSQANDVGPVTSFAYLIKKFNAHEQGAA